MRGLATIMLLCTYMCVAMATEEKRQFTLSEVYLKIRACVDMEVNAESLAECTTCCQGKTWEKDVQGRMCVQKCKDVHE